MARTSHPVRCDQTRDYGREDFPGKKRAGEPLSHFPVAPCAPVPDNEVVDLEFPDRSCLAGATPMSVVACPFCQTPLPVATRRLGQSERCPACATLFVLPGLAEVPTRAYPGTVALPVPVAVAVSCPVATPVLEPLAEPRLAPRRSRRWPLWAGVGAGLLLLVLTLVLAGGGGSSERAEARSEPKGEDEQAVHAWLTKMYGGREGGGPVEFLRWGPHYHAAELKPLLKQAVVDIQKFGLVKAVLRVRHRSGGVTKDVLYAVHEGGGVSQSMSLPAGTDMDHWKPIFRQILLGENPGY
jgi:hypothetical protein